jgi:hypothetical protein
VRVIELSILGAEGTERATLAVEDLNQVVHPFDDVDPSLGIWGESTSPSSALKAAAMALTNRYCVGLRPDRQRSGLAPGSAPPTPRLSPTGA